MPPAPSLCQSAKFRPLRPHPRTEPSKYIHIYEGDFKSFWPIKKKNKFFQVNQFYFSRPSSFHQKNTFFPNRKNNHLRLLRQQHLLKMFSLQFISSSLGTRNSRSGIDLANKTGEELIQILIRLILPLRCDLINLKCYNGKTIHQKILKLCCYTSDNVIY